MITDRPELRDAAQRAVFAHQVGDGGMAAAHGIIYRVQARPIGEIGRDIPPAQQLSHNMAMTICRRRHERGFAPVVSGIDRQQPMGKQ